MFSKNVAHTSLEFQLNAVKDGNKYIRPRKNGVLTIASFMKNVILHTVPFIIVNALYISKKEPKIGV